MQAIQVLDLDDAGTQQFLMGRKVGEYQLAIREPADDLILRKVIAGRLDAHLTQPNRSAAIEIGRVLPEAPIPNVVAQLQAAAEESDIARTKPALLQIGGADRFGIPLVAEIDDQGLAEESIQGNQVQRVATRDHVGGRVHVGVGMRAHRHPGRVGMVSIRHPRDRLKGTLEPPVRRDGQAEVDDLDGAP